MTSPDPDLIVRIAARGDGVTADGRHVALSAPGDRLRTDGSIEAGPHHVTPPCRHFPQCGGCQLQHLSDEAFTDYVRDRVAGALAGQGLSAQEVAAPYVSPPHSRRRASLRALRLGKRIQFGFSEQGSHKLIDLRECPVLDPRLFALVAPLRALFATMLPDRQPGEADLTLVDQGVDVVLSGLRADGLAHTEALLEFARENQLARLILIDDDAPMTIWEPEPATVRFGKVLTGYPPRAFLQATQDGEAALVAEVRQALGGAAMVADLFAGLGTFALSVANDVPGRKVYAAEAARDLVMALRAGGNRLPGRIFPEHRDLFRRPLTPAELNRFEAVVLDPPRAGAREQVAQIAASQVPLIVYVSCNPASFARDAVMLAEAGYRIERVKPVGQFRWSTHVELVATFRR
ncbi:MULTISPECIES: class I SAM-dependent RNA methyltransferase [Sphingobium]|uniref:class I SAM-dependent RNA methyltransferase n=1 Tax=Sphingobium TaxID=165695 RepID=UPI0015EC1B4B|nr:MULTISPECIES: class I SAM-dependent RNA methyltransferase [Sphingobium]MCW2362105.1 23S rRNA (uracil1939-C5)-methyltransferase [Sphingobium sp. B10D3B]MCW2401216.1 23S rRNA (uracil1939-C5)-methyltransferase [Sphingobium sp. B10D7B]MCW2408196.1 23S rRNA (uracil1939-C5)-methyltransferase [Sphingobium xanthum]